MMTLGRESGDLVASTCSGDFFSRWRSRLSPSARCCSSGAGHPTGGFFHDGDRAAGMFGVLATGFSVLLGFVVFLAFASFDQSRTGAEAEALDRRPAVPDRPVHARHGVGAAGRRADLLRALRRRHRVAADGGRRSAERGQPLGSAPLPDPAAVEPQSASEEAAYGKWLDQTSDREQARQDRLHGAEGIIPWPLWAALIFIAVVIGVFMLFFADSGEPKRVQAVQVGSVTIVIVVMLLLIRFLDNPFKAGPGGLEPTAMTRTLHDPRGRARRGRRPHPPPCNEAGIAR